MARIGLRDTFGGGCKRGWDRLWRVNQARGEETSGAYERMLAEFMEEELLVGVGGTGEY